MTHVRGHISMALGRIGTGSQWKMEHRSDNPPSRLNPGWLVVAADNCGVDSNLLAFELHRLGLGFVRTDRQ